MSAPLENKTSNVMATYGRAPVAMARGDGSYIWDTDARRYLDFTAGIAVTGLGHCHPHLVEALKSQAESLWHCSNLFVIPGQEELAQRLCVSSFADQVFFTNSGAEAMECALKVARRYQHHMGRPERYRTITFEGGFHGRTLATIAAAGQEKLVGGFGPMLPGFDILPLGDLAAVEASIGPETAAISIEPVQGEGGIKVVDADFLKGLRALCDAHGLALIFDEVQCGTARTGTLFAHQQSGVTPDIMAIAKGIGGGFPLGACMVTAEVGAGMTPGTHGSTFGGNPLAAAVGNAVLDIVDTPAFLTEVSNKGAYLIKALEGLKAEMPNIIAEVRGRGLMVGLKLGVPNGDFVTAARAKGLLLVPAGDNVVRLLPPLTVSLEEIDEAVALIAATAKGNL